MNAQEALEIITNAIYTDGMTAAQDKALAIAQKALEKQIPKKVIEKVDIEPLYDDNGMIDDFIDIVTFECSCCNNTIATGEIDRYCCAEICYCDNCGQKLDWESDTK